MINVVSHRLRSTTQPPMNIKAHLSTNHMQGAYSYDDAHMCAHVSIYMYVYRCLQREPDEKVFPHVAFLSALSQGLDSHLANDIWTRSTRKYSYNTYHAHVNHMIHHIVQ